MKTVYEVTVKTAWSLNSHMCAGFFPTEDMAKNHVNSWPGFIVRYLTIQPKEVEDDFVIVPPEHMQMGVASEFQKWQAPDTRDKLQKIHDIKMQHRLSSIGGDVGTAARELIRSLDGMHDQTSWMNFGLGDQERRDNLANIVEPYLKNRDDNIQEAWEILCTAWEKYQLDRTRL